MSELISIGTTVTDKNNRHLKGVIVDIHYQAGGKPSTKPYQIDWDDKNAAHIARGEFNYWGGDEIIILSEDEE